MTSSAIRFDPAGLRVMAAVWASMCGIGGYVAWSGPTYAVMRSSPLNRLLGVFLFSYGSWQLVRTVWMLAQRKPAIELGPDCLIVRGAGPPTRRIPWDGIESVNGQMNGVVVRYGSNRRLTVSSMILKGPNAADGRHVAARIDEERRAR
ncbi:MAG: hypothetical protein GY926_27280 [bacterium]|nr:hypothetical protein [bacterium]